MKMKFKLTGKIYYAVGSCHDDRSMEINERFEAPNVKAAIDKAREIIGKEHDSNKHLTDYGLHAVLEVTRSVWKVDFKDAELAMTARHARPAIKAHLEEKRTS